MVASNLLKKCNIYYHRYFSVLELISSILIILVHRHTYRVGVISKCKFISFTNTSLLTVSCIFLGVAGALILLTLLKLSVQVEATSSVTGRYADRFGKLGSMEALDRFRCNFDLGALPTDFSW